MSLRDSLVGAYAWCSLHATLLLVLAIAIPVAGTIAARLGKAGRTDADGRAIASAVVAIGVAVVVAELAAVHVAHAYFRQSVLDADARLLVAPAVCLVGCMLGIRQVFPLNQVTTVRTTLDVGALVLACGAVVWFLSMFQGWSIRIYGSLITFALLAIAMYYFLRRLYRRAFD